MTKILLVDDVDASRLTAKWFLSSCGFEVECARSAEEALTVFKPECHEVVVTDNSMPWMTGAEMASVIKTKSARTPIVMFTGSPPQDRSCLDVVIQKPAHLLVLKDALDAVLRNIAGRV